MTPPGALEQARASNEQALVDKLIWRIAPEDLDAIQQAARRGISEGIAAGLSEENVAKFWGGLGAVVHKQAKEKTGALILSGLSKGARNVVWAAVFVVAAWTLFGTKAVIAAYVALRGGS